jgi:hypothetical protein
MGAAMCQVAADPTMTLMKSRRRIASPKAGDYLDLAFNTAITAGIRARFCRRITVKSVTDQPIGA